MLVPAVVGGVIANISSFISHLAYDSVVNLSVDDAACYHEANKYVYT
jgi:hypothetical protein